MKIAIFGGSYNPLHIGHAMVADIVIKELGYDKVLFVPTCNPPHKELHSGVTAVQRFEMVKAFCDSVEENCFAVEDCEIKRGGISYTIDTVNFLIEKYKAVIEGKPALIMGEEIAAEFHKWKNPDEIADLCDLLIFPRFQESVSKNLTEEDCKNKAAENYNGDFNTEFEKSNFKYEFKYIETPAVSVSSTEIRYNIKNKKSFRYLVPEAVWKYIEQNKLYE